jgi:hypothetical protein
MIKTQLWSPNTCGCSILQQYDYSTDPPTFVGAVEQFINESGEKYKTNRCIKHQQHNNINELHLKITEDNKK